MSNNSPINISPKLEENQNYIASVMSNSPDLLFRPLFFGSNRKGLLVYLDGLVDRQYISSFVIEPLLGYSSELFLSIHILARDVLKNSNIAFARTREEVMQGLLSGQSVLFLEGSEEALLLDTSGGEARSIDKPETEVTIRGPREGFVERISVNASLLRRKLKNESLRLEEMHLGEKTHTLIYIAYLEGVANPKLVEEVRQRLQSIDIDGILETGYIEQLIEDAPQSIFPTVGATEKPDKLAAKLLEGRVGILVDGSPFAITLPYLFAEAFQNPEDYYSRPYYASIVRLLRYLAFYFSTSLPAFYVAMQSYHQEMVPTLLLISMSSGREGIPFPAIIEALIVGVAYEILREAGIRMPSNVGQAVNIVGALVIGQAAVDAGFISQAMVIVVGLTAISGFLIPPMTAPISLLRLFFLLSTAFLGMFGWLMSLLAVLIHLLSLRSFGIPYLSPLIPLNIEGLKDGVVRFPLWAMISRPSLLNPYRRQGIADWHRSLNKIKGRKGTRD